MLAHSRVPSSSQLAGLTAHEPAEASTGTPASGVPSVPAGAGDPALLPLAVRRGILPCMEIFTVASRGVRALVGSFRALGLDAAAIVAEAEVAPDSIEDPEARLPETAMLALWLAAEARWAQAGKELLGLHAGANLPLGAFDVLDYLVGTSPTLGAALQRLAEYQAIASTGLRYAIESGGGEATPVLTLTHPYALEFIPPGILEYLLAIVVTRFRTKLSPAFAPRVALRHAPQGSRETYRQVLGHVEFDAERTALHVPREQWDLTNPHHDTGLYAILERHAREVLARVPKPTGPIDRTRSAIAETLRDGDAGIERTASRLGVSVRSLQRQLAAEGSSYKEALDAVREDLARTYLATDGPSLAEVAYLLGYSDPSAFHRAFRRWTGVTPLEYRRSGEGAGDGSGKGSGEATGRGPSPEPSPEAGSPPAPDPHPDPRGVPESPH
jgi:AraC-like DNA-binding protein